MNRIYFNVHHGNSAMCACIGEPYGKYKAILSARGTDILFLHPVTMEKEYFKVMTGHSLEAICI